MNNQNLVTLQDLAKLEAALTEKISSIKGEVKVIKWLVGIIAAVLISAAAEYIAG